MGLVGKRKLVTIDAIYEALICIGHTRIWLRNNGKHNRHLITWNNLVAASYDPYIQSWYFRKKACWVNDNTKNESPPGNFLTELIDPGHAAQQMYLIDDW
ncbi:hypothetical protein EATA6166_44550 (plasmid) [Enterobacter asburiae]|nr:hypothetical protein EAS17NKHM_p10080 [Enterobacter asburiae]BEK76563.1 hypothetical protein EATA6166_44550 [Enterobacter asburiae]